MVFKELRRETFDPRGKMRLRWFGPFVLKKILSRGAVRITDLDGEEMFRLVNMDRLWKYNP